MTDFESCREVVRRGGFTDLLLLVFWSVTALLHFLITELFRVVDDLLGKRLRSVLAADRLSAGGDRREVDVNADGVLFRDLGEGSRSRSPGLRSANMVRTSAIRTCSGKKIDNRSETLGDGCGSKYIGFTKFYVVRKGRVAGIYSNWEECNAQVYGFKGAQYKSFRSLKDALNYQS
ncbi:hypothetical protein KC19_VG215300, partial [Ceratodon purpureus]